MATCVEVVEGNVEEEIELLEAIYIHELTVEGPRERPTCVSVSLHPSTADEEHKRFVCLTLVLGLPEKYPHQLPSIHVKTPRGLSEAHVSSILSNLKELAATCLGRPMLYELIEYAKECLTDNNVPSCVCAICLCHFQDTHEFTKTDCYHYFHCGCLARYVQFSLEQEKTEEDKDKVECPMCRLPIKYNLTELQTVASHTVSEDQFIYNPSEEIRKLQKKMASLFEKQKLKGGIIDIEGERNRYLIDITSVRPEESLKSSLPTGPEIDNLKMNLITDHTSKAPKGYGKSNYFYESNKSNTERKDEREFSKSSQSLGGSPPTFEKPKNKPDGVRLKDKSVYRSEKTKVSGDERTGKTARLNLDVKESDSLIKVVGLCVEDKQENDRAKSKLEKSLSMDERPNCTQKTVMVSLDAEESDLPEKEVSPNVNSKKGSHREKDGPRQGTGEIVQRKELGGANDSSIAPGSHYERTKSARRGRGKSGRGRTSGERKSEFRDGRKDCNKNSPPSQSAVKRVRKDTITEGTELSRLDDGDSSSRNATSSVDSVKTSSKQPAKGAMSTYQDCNFSFGQGRSFKEFPSTKGTRSPRTNKSKACMPPPGFERVVAIAGGCDNSTNYILAPPSGVNKGVSQHKPPPGLSTTVKGREPGMNPVVPSLSQINACTKYKS